MIEPDTKDWTWVITKPCSDCGYDAAAVDPTEVGGHVRETVPRWNAVLARPDVATRPSIDVWSPLEYACHVRDVFRVFDGRLGLILAEDGPTFDNWDQDATAVEQDYAAQDPATVRTELESAGEAVAARFDAVGPDQWERTGQRTDGAHFTIASFAVYFLHDDIHHLHDVGG